MKRILALASGFLLLVSSTAPAILDTNNNGLSDLWEKQYNSNQLFPNTTDFQLTADPDGDCWTNAQEAEAGTNPFNANLPDGFVIPELMPEQTAGTYTLLWPTVAGKLHQLQGSEALTPGTWFNIGDPVIGDGEPSLQLLDNSTTSGTPAPKCFFRVAINDIDQDHDGLTDAEEYQLGTNPSLSDSDDDGFSDYEEVQSGSNPVNKTPPISNFMEVTNFDGTVTYSWISFADNGDWFRIERKQPNGSWKPIYATTYGSAKLPYIPRSQVYSLTLNPATDFSL